MLNTRQQVINRVLELIDMTFLDDTLLQKPACFGVAVTTLCNLRCPYCVREALGAKENLHMDYDAFARHIGDIKTARRVSLFGLGEPFLNPRFFDFVKLCKDAGVYVATSTHGMSLKPEVREKLVDLQLDELNVSMDATEKKLFETLRLGANFDTVVGQVTALAELKRARGVPNPMIAINMVLHAHNVEQAPDMIRLAKKMDCQSVSFSSAVIYRPEDESINVLDTPRLEKALEAARRMGERLGIDMFFWRQKAFGARPDIYQAGAAYGCGQLNSTMIVERNGRMKTCCYIEEYQGDAFGEGLAAAFNNESMRKLRRDMMEGRVRPECQGCVFLRERTPFWIQGNLNEAARITETNELLTEDDRAKLRDLISDTERLKEAIYPEHKTIAATEIGAEFAKK
ncbi:radical SAM protein [bacterium]|nr:radical SAM protein [bacterium]